MGIRRVGLLWLGALLAATGAGAAPGCVIVGDNDALVEVNGAVVSLPFIAEDCAAASLKQGSAQACFGLHAGRADCQAMQIASPVTRVSADKSGSGIGFLASVRDLLGGDAQLRFGQTRDPGQLAGLPYGEVAMLDGLLEIRFDRMKQGDLRRFRVWRGGDAQHPLADIDRPSATLRLALGQLTRGTHYRWELMNGSGTHAGNFVIMDAYTLDQAELAPLDMTHEGSAKWRAQALAGAVACYAKGLGFDGQHLLERAGLPPRVR